MELAVTDWEKEILHLQKKKSYYTEETLLKILSSLVKTFAQLQKNNVSHRDIKPQNILIFTLKRKIIFISFHKLCIAKTLQYLIPLQAKTF
jgi:serine/threonine protein kinase